MFLLFPPSTISPHGTLCCQAQAARRLCNSDLSNRIKSLSLDGAGVLIKFLIFMAFRLSGFCLLQDYLIDMVFIDSTI